MTLSVTCFDDVEQFWARVAPLLLANEARDNLMLGIIATLRGQPDLYDEKLLACVEDDGQVVAAVLTTPPWNAVVSDVAPAAADRAADVCDLAVQALVSKFAHPSGVTASTATARNVVDSWRRHTGASARFHRGQGVYSLKRVIAPQDAPGTWRTATVADEELVLDWYKAFHDEVHLDDAPLQIMERQLKAKLRGAVGGIDLWVDDGRPVSLTGWSPATPNGARIGPVYTPPACRGRGYASSLVAATTQRLLDEGRRHCFLYTDLDNPTSNRIYQAIGYEQVGVSEDWRFQVAS